MPESIQIPPVPQSEQPHEVFLAGLPDRTRLAIQRLRTKPALPTRILTVRATGDTATQFSQIEAVLSGNGFNTTKILEAAIKALYEKLIEDGYLK